jgi:glyoxylase-like metal-dependent hydrolase (beta-lactamase superfamily II)
MSAFDPKRTFKPQILTSIKVKLVAHELSSTTVACTSAGGSHGPAAESSALAPPHGAASSSVTAYKLRVNVSVLEGSGGNIAVLTGPDGKVLVDGGIGVSRTQLTKALSDLGPEPVTHLINTHWHFDHTDGNEWLHSVGAKIIAHENTGKHLSGIQRVEDWDYNFLPLPAGAIPSELLSANRTLKLNGASLELKLYKPAHTDGDLSVTFGEADILHVADTY